MSSRARITPDKVYRRNDSLVTREIAGEVLVVPVRGQLAELQQLFVLNSVGAFVWDHLDGRRDVDDLCRGVLERFEVSMGDAETDVHEYLVRLEEAGLIVEAESPPG